MLEKWRKNDDDDDYDNDNDDFDHMLNDVPLIRGHLKYPLPCNILKVLLETN